MIDAESNPDADDESSDAADSAAEEPAAAAAAAPAEKPVAKPATATKPAGGPRTYIWGTGRRKTSVARVRIAPGSGKIIINKRPLKDYFPRLDHQSQVKAPLTATERERIFDAWINVRGGGITGQAEACLLGIARALVHSEPENEELHATLKAGGLLTRDSREVERKKYGRRGARRRFQFSKR